MSFGKTLARLREAAGLTQAQLANKANLSIDTLRGWEQERSLPRVDDAFRLAKALGVGVEKLIIAVDMETAGRGEPARPKKPKGKGGSK
jgi:transcriptional regulator with XRE-family HTH domain